MDKLLLAFAGTAVLNLISLEMPRYLGHSWNNRILEHRSGWKLHASRSPLIVVDAIRPLSDNCMHKMTILRLQSVRSTDKAFIPGKRSPPVNEQIKCANQESLNPPACCEDCQRTTFRYTYKLFHNLQQKLTRAGTGPKIVRRGFKTVERRLGSVRWSFPMASGVSFLQRPCHN